MADAVGDSDKTAQAQEETKQNRQKEGQDATEESRLKALFPGLDTNPEIVAIKEMFVQGCICKELAPPRFFDGLLYVMEQNWSKCVNVFTIYLELVPNEEYEENIYLVSGVLNQLIERTSLQSLTLKEFPPELLLDSLMTLPRMEQLDYLDVSHNSLGTSGLDEVLRQLPRDPIDLIEANFEHNDITNEENVGLLLRNKPNLKSVKILDQGSGKLDAAQIRAKMNNSFDLL